MTCRHSAGDPACSSNRSYYEPEPKKPDADKYSIEDVERVGSHLVMKVKYPNCYSCSYEGTKVMVFLNVSELEALRWKRIDPHFSDPKYKRSPTAAPSPAARFPASEQGWSDALAYAKSRP